MAESLESKKMQLESKKTQRAVGGPKYPGPRRRLKEKNEGEVQPPGVNPITFDNLRVIFWPMC